MKKLLFAALALAFVCAAAYSSEIPVESKISRVTVYPDSSLITRSASIDLSPGAHVLSFDSLLPEIDENSITASASGPAGVKLFGARVERKFTREMPGDEINRIQKEIQSLRDEITSQQNHKKLLADKKAFLDSRTLAPPGDDSPARMPSAAELAEITEFLEREFAGYYAGTARADREIRMISERIDLLQRELGQISGPGGKMTRTVLIELEAQDASRLDVSFSYLVRGASWRPSYDARARFDTGTVELVSYGNIIQRTGEDWDEAQITLSTARPSAGGEMPPVSSWVLRPYQPPVSRDTLMKESMRREAAAPGEADDVRHAYAEAAERGTAINYELPRKASIKSDGSAHKLPVSSQTLSAEFEYSSHPARGQAAYLGATVRNSDKLQLLPGPVNIFMEGDFSGRARMGAIAPGEEFLLPLGLDENVKVSRELLERKVDETGFGGIPSRTKSTTLRYKITAENYKSSAIRLNIFEPVPVPEDDRIRVNITNVSVQPSEKDWQDMQGVWLWELDISPGQHKEIFYTMAVTHPRTMRVEGL